MLLISGQDLNSFSINTLPMKPEPLEDKVFSIALDIERTDNISLHLEILFYLQ